MSEAPLWSWAICKMRESSCWRSSKICWAEVKAQVGVQLVYIYIYVHTSIYIYTPLYIYIKCSPQPHSPNSCSDVELRAIVFVSEEETSQRLRKEVRLILLLLSLLSAETTRRLIRTWTMHILKGLEPHTIRKGLELQNLCTIACFWWANHRQNDAIPSYPGFVPETALPTYQKYSKML